MIDSKNYKYILQNNTILHRGGQNVNLYQEIFTIQTGIVDKVLKVDYI